MDLLTIIIIVAAVAIVSAVIWWYYPWVRKPWGPSATTKDNLSKLCKSASVDYPPKKPKVVVYKSQRKLELYDDDKLIKTYKIALGTNPVDDKRKEGDGCTPEGEFYICTKNDRSKFHLFLGISYPNNEDAERGLRTNLINQSEYNKIINALEQKKRPAWDTRLGGEIGFHGAGTGADWTQGCVALENQDIEELFMLLDIGTEVRIFP